MSQVKQVSIKINTFDSRDASLNFSNCYNIESLSFDFGLENYWNFRQIITNFFNKSKTDLILPHIFKEEDSSSDDDPGYRRDDLQPPNQRSGARSLSQRRMNQELIEPNDNEPITV